MSPRVRAVLLGAWRVVRRPVVRVPGSVLVAVLVVNGIASADIPKWALELTTQQYACSPFCNSGGSGGGGATPTPGGGGGGGGGNTPVAGIDIGGWTGTPTPAAQYQYASFAASAGTGSACPDPQNSRWASPNGPDAWVSETAQQFNAFWFLRSLEYARRTAGRRTTATPPPSGAPSRPISCCRRSPRSRRTSRPTSPPRSPTSNGRRCRHIATVLLALRTRTTAVAR